ncbi:HECT-domain (ubiquitin-transferase) domain-containing protein, partial [Toxoplasma gondii RUB]
SCFSISSNLERPSYFQRMQESQGSRSSDSSSAPTSSSGASSGASAALEAGETKPEKGETQASRSCGDEGAASARATSAPTGEAPRPSLRFSYTPEGIYQAYLRLQENGENGAQAPEAPVRLLPHNDFGTCDVVGLLRSVQCEAAAHVLVWWSLAAKCGASLRLPDDAAMLAVSTGALGAKGPAAHAARRLHAQQQVAEAFVAASRHKGERGDRKARRASEEDDVEKYVSERDWLLGPLLAPFLQRVTGFAHKVTYHLFDTMTPQRRAWIHSVFMDLPPPSRTGPASSTGTSGRASGGAAGRGSLHARRAAVLRAAMVEQLTEMGFGESSAQRAVDATNGRSIELAMEWLFERQREEEAAASTAPSASAGAAANASSESTGESADGARGSASGEPPTADSFEASGRGDAAPADGTQRTGASGAESGSTTSAGTVLASGTEAESRSEGHSQTNSATGSGSADGEAPAAALASALTAETGRDTEAAVRPRDSRAETRLPSGTQPASLGSPLASSRAAAVAAASALMGEVGPSFDYFGAFLLPSFSADESVSSSASELANVTRALVAAITGGPGASGANGFGRGLSSAFYGLGSRGRSSGGGDRGTGQATEALFFVAASASLAGRLDLDEAWAGGSRERLLAEETGGEGTGVSAGDAAGAAEEPRKEDSTRKTGSRTAVWEGPISAHISDQRALEFSEKIRRQIVPQLLNLVCVLPQSAASLCEALMKLLGAPLDLSVDPKRGRPESGVDAGEKRQEDDPKRRDSKEAGPGESGPEPDTAQAAALDTQEGKSEEKPPQQEGSAPNISKGAGEKSATGDDLEGAPLSAAAHLLQQMGERNLFVTMRLLTTRLLHLRQLCLCVPELAFRLPALPAFFCANAKMSTAPDAASEDVCEPGTVSKMWGFRAGLLALRLQQQLYGTCLLLAHLLHRKRHAKGMLLAVCHATAALMRRRTPADRDEALPGKRGPKAGQTPGARAPAAGPAAPLAKKSERGGGPDRRLHAPEKGRTGGAGREAWLGMTATLARNHPVGIFWKLIVSTLSEEALLASAHPFYLSETKGVFLIPQLFRESLGPSSGGAAHAVAEAAARSDASFAREPGVKLEAGDAKTPSESPEGPNPVSTPVLPIASWCLLDLPASPAAASSSSAPLMTDAKVASIVPFPSGPQIHPWCCHSSSCSSCSSSPSCAVSSSPTCLAAAVPAASRPPPFILPALLCIQELLPLYLLHERPATSPGLSPPTHAPGAETGGETHRGARYRGSSRSAPAGPSEKGKAGRHAATSSDSQGGANASTSGSQNAGPLASAGGTGAKERETPSGPEGEGSSLASGSPGRVLPIHEQKQMVAGCLDLLHFYPGIDGDTTLAILQILHHLTVVPANALHLLLYSPKGSLLSLPSDVSGGDTGTDPRRRFEALKGAKHEESREDPEDAVMGEEGSGDTKSGAPLTASSLASASRASRTALGAKTGSCKVPALPFFSISATLAHATSSVEMQAALLPPPAKLEACGTERPAEMRREDAPRGPSGERGGSLGGGLGLLLSMPRTAGCNGMLTLIQQIVSHACEEQSVLAAFIENEIRYLFKRAQLASRTLYRRVHGAPPPSAEEEENLRPLVPAEAILETLHPFVQRTPVLVEQILRGCCQFCSTACASREQGGEQTEPSEEGLPGASSKPPVEDSRPETQAAGGSASHGSRNEEKRSPPSASVTPGPEGERGRTPEAMKTTEEQAASASVRSEERKTGDVDVHMESEEGETCAKECAGSKKIGSGEEGPPSDEGREKTAEKEEAEKVSPPAPPPEAIPCGIYVGHKKGFVFRRGIQGVGYYPEAEGEKHTDGGERSEPVVLLRWLEDHERAQTLPHQKKVKRLLLQARKSPNVAALLMGVLTDYSVLFLNVEAMTRLASAPLQQQPEQGEAKASELGDKKPLGGDGSRDSTAGPGGEKPCEKRKGEQEEGVSRAWRNLDSVLHPPGVSLKGDTEGWASNVRPMYPFALTADSLFYIMIQLISSYPSVLPLLCKPMPLLSAPTPATASACAFEVLQEGRAGRERDDGAAVPTRGEDKEGIEGSSEEKCKPAGAFSIPKPLPLHKLRGGSGHQAGTLDSAASVTNADLSGPGRVDGMHAPASGGGSAAPGTPSAEMIRLYLPQPPPWVFTSSLPSLVGEAAATPSGFDLSRILHSHHGQVPGGAGERRSSGLARGEKKPEEGPPAQATAGSLTARSGGEEEKETDFASFSAEPSDASVSCGAAPVAQVGACAPKGLSSSSAPVRPLLDYLLRDVLSRLLTLTLPPFACTDKTYAAALELQREKKLSGSSLSLGSSPALVSLNHFLQLLGAMACCSLDIRKVLFQQVSGALASLARGVSFASNPALLSRTGRERRESSGDVFDIDQEVLRSQQREHIQLLAAEEQRGAEGTDCYALAAAVASAAATGNNARGFGLKDARRGASAHAAHAVHGSHLGKAAAAGHLPGGPGALAASASSVLGAVAGSTRGGEKESREASASSVVLLQYRLPADLQITAFYTLSSLLYRLFTLPKELPPNPLLLPLSSTAPPTQNEASPEGNSSSGIPRGCGVSGPLPFSSRGGRKDDDEADSGNSSSGGPSGGRSGAGASSTSSGTGREGRASGASIAVRGRVASLAENGETVGGEQEPRDEAAVAARVSDSGLPPTTWLAASRNQASSARQQGGSGRPASGSRGTTSESRSSAARSSGASASGEGEGDPPKGPSAGNLFSGGDCKNDASGQGSSAPRPGPTAPGPSLKSQYGLSLDDLQRLRDSLSLFLFQLPLHSEDAFVSVTIAVRCLTFLTSPELLGLPAVSRDASKDRLRGRGAEGRGKSRGTRGGAEEEDEEARRRRERARRVRRASEMEDDEEDEEEEGEDDEGDGEEDDEEDEDDEDEEDDIEQDEDEDDWDIEEEPEDEDGEVALQCELFDLEDDEDEDDEDDEMGGEDDDEAVGLTDEEDVDADSADSEDEAPAAAGAGLTSTRELPHEVEEEEELLRETGEVEEEEDEEEDEEDDEDDDAPRIRERGDLDYEELLDEEDEDDELQPHEEEALMEDDVSDIVSSLTGRRRRDTGDGDSSPDASSDEDHEDLGDGHDGDGPDSASEAPDQEDEAIYGANSTAFVALCFTSLSLFSLEFVLQISSASPLEGAATGHGASSSETSGSSAPAEGAAEEDSGGGQGETSRSRLRFLNATTEDGETGLASAFASVSGASSETRGRLPGGSARRPSSSLPGFSPDDMDDDDDDDDLDDDEEDDDDADDLRFHFHLSADAHRELVSAVRGVVSGGRRQGAARDGFDDEFSVDVHLGPQRTGASLGRVSSGAGGAVRGRDAGARGLVGAASNFFRTPGGDSAGLGNGGAHFFIGRGSGFGAQGAGSTRSPFLASPQASGFAPFLGGNSAGGSVFSLFAGPGLGSILDVALGAGAGAQGTGAAHPTLATLTGQTGYQQTWTSWDVSAIPSEHPLFSSSLCRASHSNGASTPASPLQGTSASASGAGPERGAGSGGFGARASGGRPSGSGRDGRINERFLIQHLLEDLSQAFGSEILRTPPSGGAPTARRLTSSSQNLESPRHQAGAAGAESHPSREARHEHEGRDDGAGFEALYGNVNFFEEVEHAHQQRLATAAVLSRLAVTGTGSGAFLSLDDVPFPVAAPTQPEEPDSREAGEREEMEAAAPEADQAEEGEEASTGEERPGEERQRTDTTTGAEGEPSSEEARRAQISVASTPHSDRPEGTALREGTVDAGVLPGASVEPAASAQREEMEVDMEAAPAPTPQAPQRETLEERSPETEPRDAGQAAEESGDTHLQGDIQASVETDEMPSTSQDTANANEQPPTSDSTSSSSPSSASSSSSSSSASSSSSSSSSSSPEEGGGPLAPLARALGLTEAQLFDAAGMDPSFLEALPEDLREEIVVQQLRQLTIQAVEQRRSENESLCSAPPSSAGEEAPRETEAESAAATHAATEAVVGGQPAEASGPQPTSSSRRPGGAPPLSEIRREYLSALPSALRQQVIAACRANEEASGDSGAQQRASTSQEHSDAGTDLDNATFLATLDPALRQEVLLTAGSDFLRTLPTEIMAEASLLRERVLQRSQHARSARDRGAAAQGGRGDGDRARGNASAHGRGDRDRAGLQHFLGFIRGNNGGAGGAATAGSSSQTGASSRSRSSTGAGASQARGGQGAGSGGGAQAPIFSFGTRVGFEGTDNLLGERGNGDLYLAGLFDFLDSQILQGGTLEESGRAGLGRLQSRGSAPLFGVQSFPSPSAEDGLGAGGAGGRGRSMDRDGAGFLGTRGGVRGAGPPEARNLSLGAGNPLLQESAVLSGTPASPAGAADPLSLLRGSHAPVQRAFQGADRTPGLSSNSALERFLQGTWAAIAAAASNSNSFGGVTISGIPSSRSALIVNPNSGTYPLLVGAGLAAPGSAGAPSQGSGAGAQLGSSSGFFGGSVPGGAGTQVNVLLTGGLLGQGGGNLLSLLSSSIRGAGARPAMVAGGRDMLGNGLSFSGTSGGGLSGTVVTRPDGVVDGLSALNEWLLLSPSVNAAGHPSSFAGASGLQTDGGFRGGATSRRGSDGGYEVVARSPAGFYLHGGSPLRGPRPPFHPLGVLGICRLFYLRKEINRKLFFTLLCNVASAHQDAWHLLVLLFLVICWSAAPDCHQPESSSARSSASSPPLSSVGFPPSALYGALFEGASSNAVALFERPSAAAVATERVLEQLRSLLTVLPSASAAFAHRMRHPQAVSLRDVAYPSSLSAISSLFGKKDEKAPRVASAPDDFGPGRDEPKKGEDKKREIQGKGGAGRSRGRQGENDRKPLEEPEKSGGKKDGANLAKKEKGSRDRGAAAERGDGEERGEATHGSDATEESAGAAKPRACIERKEEAAAQNGDIAAEKGRESELFASAWRRRTGGGTEEDGRSRGREERAATLGGRGACDDEDALGGSRRSGSGDGEDLVHELRRKKKRREWNGAALSFGIGSSPSASALSPVGVQPGGGEKEGGEKETGRAGTAVSTDGQCLPEGVGVKKEPEGGALAPRASFGDPAASSSRVIPGTNERASQMRERREEEKEGKSAVSAGRMVPHEKSGGSSGSPPGKDDEKKIVFGEGVEDATLEYPINVLMTLTSGTLFQSSPRLMNHLLSAVYFLLVGGDGAGSREGEGSATKASSSQRRSGASASAPERGDSPGVTGVSESSGSPPVETVSSGAPGVSEDAGAAAPTVAVASKPRPEETGSGAVSASGPSPEKENAMLRVVSPTAGRALCQLLCSPSVAASWSQGAHTPQQREAHQQQLNLVAKVVGCLYSSTQHRAWVEEALKQNATTLSRGISDELRLLAETMRASVRFLGRDSGSPEPALSPHDDLWRRRDLLDPQLAAFNRLCSTLSDVLSQIEEQAGGKEKEREQERAPRSPTSQGNNASAVCRASRAPSGQEAEMRETAAPGSSSSAPTPGAPEGPPAASTSPERSEEGGGSAGSSEARDTALQSLEAAALEAIESLNTVAMSTASRQTGARASGGKRGEGAESRERVSSALVAFRNFFDQSGVALIWEQLDDVLTAVEECYPSLTMQVAAPGLLPPREARRRPPAAVREGDEGEARREEEDDEGRGSEGRRRRVRREEELEEEEEDGRRREDAEASGLVDGGREVWPASAAATSAATSAPTDDAAPLILSQLLPILEAYLQVHQTCIAADYDVKEVADLGQLDLFSLASEAANAPCMKGGTPDSMASPEDEKRRTTTQEDALSPRVDSRAAGDTGQLAPLSPSAHASAATASPSQRHAELCCFGERHKASINALVKQTPSLLTTTLQPLLKLAPMTVAFENKRLYFRHKIREMRQSARFETIRLSVRRDQVFTDSYHQIRMRSGEEMKGKLNVHFTGEEGVDAGGLTREWFSLLARDMFNPNYALFRREGAKSEFNHPNPLSSINPEHLHYFKFIGRIIGKALFDGQHLNAYFCRSFYKHMLGRRCVTADAESIDPTLYNNLLKMLQYSLEDLGLELTFSTEVDEFGMHRIEDLIPNGRTIPVTDANKHLYVQLICQRKIVGGIQQQLEAFLSGFHELIPPALISIFDDKELELLLSGLPTVNLEDLKANTDYVNFLPTDQTIVWFWEVSTVVVCVHPWPYQ